MKVIKTLLLLLLVSMSISCSQQQDAETYFPPENGHWENVTQQDAKWNVSALEGAIDYAEDQHSSGLFILVNGKILVEEYWTEKKEVHSEDVASIQKSVVSLLCGMAVSKNILDIHSPVNTYIESGWSHADVEKENEILVRHLLSMSSGLDSDLNFEYAPGEHWSYNTKAYSQLIYVLEAISQKDIIELTQEWLTEPIGIVDSKWIKRGEQAANPYGFKANLRDLGRLGLLTLNHGFWGNKDIINNTDYLKEAFHPSQSMNVKYGYLFWLNTEFQYHSKCPEDLIIMVGARNRYVYIFPGENIVIVRLGEKTEEAFNEKFLDLIVNALPD